MKIKKGRPCFILFKQGRVCIVPYFSIQMDLNIGVLSVACQQVNKQSLLDPHNRQEKSNDVAMNFCNISPRVQLWDQVHEECNFSM